MLPRLLILATDPPRTSGGAALDLPHEIGRITRALDGKLDVVQRFGFLPDDISSEIRKVKPLYLHISCHVDHQGFIRYGSEHDDSLGLLDVACLADLVQQGVEGQRLRQIVLASCNGEDVVERLADVADIVIGFKGRISDNAVSYLMPRFYRLLFDPETSTADAIRLTRAIVAERHEAAGDQLLCVTAPGVDLDTVIHSPPPAQPASTPELSARGLYARLMAKLHSDTDIYPNLPLFEKRRIGEYGFFRRGRFNCLGNLRDFGVALVPQTERGAGGIWSDRVQLHQLGARDLRFDFGARGAYYLELDGVDKTHLRERGALDAAIIGLSKAGRWDRTWHIVVEIWSATHASMMIAGEAGATIVLSRPPRPDSSIAGKDLELRVASRSGTIQAHLQVADAVPLFSTARLRGWLHPSVRAPETRARGDVFDAPGVVEALDETSFEEFLGFGDS